MGANALKIGADRTELFFLENLAWFLALFFYIMFGAVKPWAMFSFDFVVFMLHSVIALGFLVMAESICLVTNNIDLSIGEMTGFVGMAAGFLIAAYPGIPFYLTILIPVGIGMLCGSVNGFLIGPLKFPPFLVTLGTLMAFQGGTFMIRKRDIEGSLLPQFYLSFGGIPLLAIVSFVVILVFVAIVLKYSRFGVHLYYVGGGAIASEMMGINLKRTYFATYTISGLLVGLSALYYTGYINSVSITMADGSLFPAFAGAVIGGISLSGGRGSISNAFAGTLLLGVVEAGLTMFAISPEGRMVAYGIMVIGAIVINSVRDRVRDRVLKAIRPGVG